MVYIPTWTGRTSSKETRDTSNQRSLPRFSILAGVQRSIGPAMLNAACAPRPRSQGAEAAGAAHAGARPRGQAALRGPTQVDALAELERKNRGGVLTCSARLGDVWGCQNVH